METVFDLSFEELVKFFKGLNEPKYRATQVFNWLYKKRVIDPLRYTDISLPLREKLKPLFKRNLTLVHRLDSKDGSSKFAFLTLDGSVVESVLMRHVKHGKKRYTVCLSSQVGCPIGCRFCASGKSFKRSLRASEIVEQLWAVQEYLDSTEGTRVSNIVFMGMGEPLLNYDNVVKAIRIITHDAGLNISSRSITVSTVGIPSKILALSKDAPRVKLAISLHAPNDEIRRKLIPIAKLYTIEEIIDATYRYYLTTKRRVTIEYVMLNGVNDSEDDAKALVKLVKRIKPLVNLIPYNPVPNVPFKRPPLHRIRRFAEIVSQHLEVSIRFSFGEDIRAACGQLRAELEGIDA